MTDFVRRALRPDRDDWIYRSHLNTDYYKFNMGAFNLAYLPDTQVTFGLINRSRRIPLGLMIDEGELRRQLDHARTVVMELSDWSYLSGMDAYGVRYLPESYLAWLKNLRLCEYSLKRVGDQYEFRVSGTNREGVSFWETVVMCIMLELKTRAVLRYMKPIELDVMYARATDKLYQKLKFLTQFPDISIINFGTRRRHGFLWERKVCEMALEVLGRKRFRGISNVALAKETNTVPSGTNAHELPMQRVALAYPHRQKMIDAQYDVLRDWAKLFPQPLRVVLGDAYTTDQFYRNMPPDLLEDVVRTWRGERQDSGDPSGEAEKFIARHQRFGVDPREKLFIFSDGLEHKQIAYLYNRFHERVGTSYGWGTHLTNDFHDCHPRGDEPFTHIKGVNLTWNQALAPISLVCKVIEVDGTPAVKLSNNPNKATGPTEMVNYYKDTYGVGAQVAQDVVV